MNRIVLIGNGFDLAHDLKTKYEHFIDWYWDYRVGGFANERTNISKDVLCTFKNLSGNAWKSFYEYYMSQFFGSLQKIEGYKVIQFIRNNQDNYEITSSPFFKNICTSVETKGWVDIENEYYFLLKKYALSEDFRSKIVALNNELSYIQERLIEYLELINQQKINSHNGIKEKIYAPINSQDISVEASKIVKDYVQWWSKRDRNAWERKLYDYGISGAESYNYIYDIEDYKKGNLYHSEYPNLFMLPDKIMLLSFNYTKTAQTYLMEGKQNFEINFIHGKIENPSSVIFGYGDELDEKYNQIQNLNDNECLRNVKTIKYQESDNYRKVLAFIESAPFQVYIMGHSCGNSDRTLLNKLFEHKNCISIKPYYYKKEDGTDNYLELAQNISRNFTDMNLMRDRVVNKTYCEPLT